MDIWMNATLNNDLCLIDGLNKIYSFMVITSSTNKYRKHKNSMLIWVLPIDKMIITQTFIMANCCQKVKDNRNCLPPIQLYSKMKRQLFHSQHFQHQKFASDIICLTTCVYSMLNRSVVSQPAFSAPRVSWTQQMFPALIIHSSASPSTDQTWSSGKRRGSTPHSTVLSARTFRCHLHWASWRLRPPPQLPPALSHGLAVQGETSKSGYNMVWLFNGTHKSGYNMVWLLKRRHISQVTTWFGYSWGDAQVRLQHGLAVQWETWCTSLVTKRLSSSEITVWTNWRTSLVIKRLSSSDITVRTNWTFEHSLWPWPSTQQSSVVTEHFGLRWSIVTLHLVAQESLVQ